MSLARSHRSGGNRRVSTRIAAWLVILIYLVGPFQVQLCTAACATNEECCKPVPACCGGETGQPAHAPNSCDEDRDCCIELSSEPPIGVLQNIAPAPMPLPVTSNSLVERLPETIDAQTVLREYPSTPSGPPLFILHDVLRR